MRLADELPGPSTGAQAFLHLGRRERTPLVTVEECAEQMGRSIREVVALARAGVLEAEFDGTDVRRVRPAVLSGPVLEE